MRRLLLAALLAAFPLGAQAQFRAVGLDGGTFLFNNNGVATVSQSYGGTVSFWYISTYPKTAGIYQVSAGSSSNAPGLLVMLEHHADGVRFVLYLSPAGQSGSPAGQPGSFMKKVGSAPLPYDTSWHHIYATWDIRTPAAYWALDGVVQNWDSLLSSQTVVNVSQPFQVKYEATVVPARWFVAGAPSTGYAPYIVHNAGSVSLFLAPVWGKFVGSLSEVYFHVGDNDLYDIINPFRAGGGFGAKATIDGVNVARPLELGPACIAVFGVAGGMPEICMRGGPGFFPNNQGGATAFVVQGTLHAVASDPFDLWP
jgi:hypothetical protein